MFRKKSNEENQLLQRELEDKITQNVKEALILQLDHKVEELISKELKEIQEKVSQTIEGIQYKCDLIATQKLEVQSEEISRNITKSLKDMDAAIQKEKNQIVLERQRMKMDMELEYNKLNLEWKKLRDEKRSMEIVQKFRTNRVKLNVGGTVNQLKCFQQIDFLPSQDL